MTGQPSHDPSDARFATPERIRRAADREFLPEDAAALEALESGEAAGSAIAFERELRAAVGRVMGEVRAPAGLGERVRAAMAAAPSTDAIHLDDVRDGLVEAAAAPAAPAAPAPAAAAAAAPAAAAPGPAPDRMSILRWLDSPRRANAAAVAAVLALVLGAIGFGIVMPTISEWGHAQPIRFVEQAASFAANEHGRCSADGVRDGKITQFTTVEDGRAFLAVHLNRPLEQVRIPDLTEHGYSFISVAACRVPGGLPSAHVVWRSIEPGPDGGHALVSGFVTLDRNQFELPESGAADIRVGGVALSDGSTCSRVVRVVREGGLAFLMVCCKEQSLDVCSRKFAREFISAGR